MRRGPTFSEYDLVACPAPGLQPDARQYLCARGVSIDGSEAARPCAQNVGADAGGASVRDDVLYYAVVVGSGVVSVVIFALVVFDVVR
jgi:hypothetical protein